jgi:hypothetical protein
MDINFIENDEARLWIDELDKMQEEIVEEIKRSETKETK